MGLQVYAGRAKEPLSVINVEFTIVHIQGTIDIEKKCKVIEAGRGLEASSHGSMSEVIGRPRKHTGKAAEDKMKKVGPSSLDKVIAHQPHRRGREG